MEGKRDSGKEAGGEDVGEVEDAVQDMDSRLEDMEARADEVEQDVEGARGDWERKQADSSVPGAEPSGDDA